jgi:superfamily II DNA or RNA helicase
MALYLVAQLKTKTLILVHKEFLMNQWIERIAEFLPSARVGKIQGAVYDVDNQDIVIGMIQSLYNDNRYHKDHLNSFGLTVIDETHRIGSEQFCQTLWKVPTRLMLGISATVDRKDGLTDILFHFIGPKLYSETKPIQDHPVVVHCHPLPAQLCSPEFLEVVHDRMGQVQITSMLSKVCSYEPRLQYAMHLLQQTLHQFPGNQVMVLAHQRALLTRVHDWIQEKQMGTVGYYVGGMKDAALKATESKQIVLATYAMAAEALDIKSLSSLLLLTPKVDVVQSVGRILRERHDHPVVLDLVDPHRCFQNQFKKRLAYYRSCKYQIVMHKKDTGFQEEEEDQEDLEDQEDPPAKRVSMFRLTGNKTHD